MANDFLLKEVRRLIKVEINKSEVWQKLDTLLGENIKEAVLDSEIQVKKQELVVIKQDIVTAAEQWEQDRGKREMETKSEVARLDQYLTAKRNEHEVGLVDLKAQAEKKEAEYKNVIRGQEQRISQAQKKTDKEVEEIREQISDTKLKLLEDLNKLTALRDQMKGEVHAYQKRFGVAV